MPGLEHADPLVLASGSPRRRDLLMRAGIRFEICPADIPEERGPDEMPEPFARRMAREKALAVARKVGTSPRRFVLGADTIVVLGERVLGKPQHAEHALELLEQIVGREHVVITAVALADSETLRVRELAVSSRVAMQPATRDALRRYVATGEPLDKAGAYAYQGEGRRLVRRLIGSETNVIGLPLEQTLALLREHAGLVPDPSRGALDREAAGSDAA